eukprot:77164_1
MAICTLLLLSAHLLQIAHGQCSWTVDGNTLDLGKCLAGETITAKDPGDHHYSWSICRNGETCKQQDIMVVQRAGDLCYILGQWDAAIQPKYEATNGGTWTFIYDNGDTDCGSPARTWSPKLVCTPGTHWESGIVNEATGSCYYEVEIKTQYACAASQNTGCVSAASSDSSLSGGWIFIIILLSGLFLYCVAGYLIMGLSVNTDGGLGDFANNIPQKSFWIVLPSLVIAGCSVTFEFCSNKVNDLRNKGNEGQEALVTDN